MDNCEGIKSEIKNKFVPIRNKRMQHPENREHEHTTQSRRVQQRPRCKASKSLAFSGTSNTISPVHVATSLNEAYQCIKQSLAPSHNTCLWYNFN